MPPKDEFTLEQRAKTIWFNSRELKEYGSIEVPEFNDIKYRLRYNKPTEKRGGFLDIVFVVPLTEDVCIIEAKLEFNKKGEFTPSSILDLSHQPYNRLNVTYEMLGSINNLELYTKGSDFDYANICRNKINELLKNLLE